MTLAQFLRQFLVRDPNGQEFILAPRPALTQLIDSWENPLPSAAELCEKKRGIQYYEG